MQWNLRMVAAQRGLWRASELRRALAEAGLSISAGKMSHLWSGTPISVRLQDLDVICSVLQCEPNDLLTPAGTDEQDGNVEAAQMDRPTRAVTPSKHRRGRSQPPV